MGTPLESVMLPFALHGQDVNAGVEPDADVDAGTANPRQSVGVIHAALT